jgi:5'-nucleotidase
MEIKRGKDKIFDTATPNSPVTITTWSGNEDNRMIMMGDKKEFKLKFQNNADMTLGNYTVEIEFDSGTIICVDDICGAPDPDTPVGTITETIFRGGTPPGVDRGVESAAVNLVADAQAWATLSNGAEIAFMNPGGVRSDLTYFQSGGEGDGVVTYGEAMTFQPFGNTLITFPMTFAQIISVLEEQCQPPGSSRPILHLGVSDGFTYDLATTIAGGDCTSVAISNVKLNGVNLIPGAAYFVTVNSFVAAGGDNFSTFATLDPATGIDGGVDLQALVDYLGSFSPVAPPSTDRVNELP